jgi:hypothetical protein
MLVRLRKADNERGGKRKKRERTIRGKQKQKSHHPTQIPEKIPTPAISRGNKNARKENERNSNSAHCALGRALGPKSSNQALFFSSLPNLCRNSYKWTLPNRVVNSRGERTGVGDSARSLTGAKGGPSFSRCPRQ